MTSAAEVTKTYYGWTKNGKRIHLGTHVEVITASGAYVAQAFCGVLMRADGRGYEQGDPERAIPGRVTEFCRGCFRSVAWQYYENHLMEEAERA